MPVVGSSLSVETRIVSTEFGFLEATIDSRVKAPAMIPRTVLTSDNLSGMFFGGSTPSIRLATSAGPLTLGANGFTLGRGSLTEYSAAELRKLAQRFQSDARLQDATLSLRKTFSQTIYEIAGTQSIAPPPRLSKSLLDANTRIARFGKKPRGLDCTVERLVTTVTTEIEGWVESVVSATDQLVKCEEKCRRDNPPDRKPLEYGACIAGCGLKVFEDVVTRTWGVVDTITDEVVTEITHCSPVAKLFATPWGKVEIPGNFTVPGASAAAAPKIKPAEIVKVLGPFGDVLKCLVRGDWRVTNLDDVGVDIPGLGSVPFGVTVCLDRTCANTLRDVSTGIALLTFVGKLIETFSKGGGPNGGIEAVIKALGLSAEVSSIAVVAGVTVGEMLQIILAAFLVLVAHAVIVGGQIAVIDFLGLAPNGICLTYPALPGVAVGVLNPVIGFEILANTPIVVTPR